MKSRIFLGMTDEGDRVFANIELRSQPPVAPYQTVDHVDLDPNSEYTELAITFEMIEKGRKEPSSVGAGTAWSVRAVTKPAVPFTARLAAVTEEWHLNGMSAGCSHQTVVYEDSRGGQRPSLERTKPCPETGYKYGSAWLVKPLPAEIEQEVREWMKAGDQR
jgi:hypothetical protein